jgi:DNA repair protein RadD
MIDFVPRWYQVEGHAALHEYFAHNDGHPIVSMPTGAGKSAVIAMFCYSTMLNWPNTRILILTHVKELIRQDYKALTKLWHDAPAGIFSSGLGKREGHMPIVFGGVGSVVRNLALIGWIDLLIIDECHLLGDNEDSMYLRIIADLMAVNPKLKVIGFTATAWRTGMGMLTNGKIFTDVAYNLCTPARYQRLFDDYHLVPPRAKQMQTEFDVSNVKIIAGEFSKKGLEQVARHEAMTWQALNESLKKNPDRICRLVFCSGVDHAVLTNEMLKYLGLRSAVVHSRMTDGDRDDIMNAFFAGELDALTNNGIATTGVDHPPIDHIIELRATMSVGLHCQMIGRGMRPYEIDGYRKEYCVVSDHSGNTKRLGPIDDPYIPKMKGKAAGDMPVKICPACDGYNHAAARVCDHCGEPFDIKIGYVKSAYETPLVVSDLPIIETFNVDNVFYTIHNKKDARPQDKPTLKATYSCGLQKFVEFVPLEHDGPIKRKAQDWWKRRFDGSHIPETVSEAMKYVAKLNPPKSINVHVNRKYPEITGYGY